MGTTKKKAYSKQTLDLVLIANGLSHPARITIVKYLQENYVGNNKKFEDLTGLSKTTVSQHLKELKHSRLVYSDYMLGEPNYQLHRKAEKRISKLILELTK